MYRFFEGALIYTKKDYLVIGWLFAEACTADSSVRRDGRKPAYRAGRTPISGNGCPAFAAYRIVRMIVGTLIAGRAAGRKNEIKIFANH